MRLTSNRTDLKSYRQLCNVIGQERFIGSGCGRMVFELSPTKVIKVAYNDNGIKQNKTELSQWNKIKDSGMQRYVAAVRYASRNGEVIVSDKVLSVNNDEFCDIAKVGFVGNRPNMSDILDFWMDGSVGKNIQKRQIKERIKYNKFLRDFQVFAKKFPDILWDLHLVSNWGKQGGKLVLLDYGSERKYL